MTDTTGAPPVYRIGDAVLVRRNADPEATWFSGRVTGVQQLQNGRWISVQMDLTGEIKRCRPSRVRHRAHEV